MYVMRPVVIALLTLLAARAYAEPAAPLDDARLGASEVNELLKAGQRTRALEVLTDLAERGYAPAAAAHAVTAVAKQGPTALNQLVATAERLRSGNSATATEALDAVQRATGRGLGLDRAAEVLRHGDVGDDNGRGPDRETSGARGNRNGNGNGNGNGKVRDPARQASALHRSSAWQRSAGSASSSSSSPSRAARPQSP
jgi:hypothetical protein